MSLTRAIAVTALTAATLVAIPAGTASAHVHGINPLSCIQTDSPNSGGLRTNTTPAAAANGGPISMVIPIAMGGNVQPREPEFFGVCRN
jgi:hypothetical protein